MESIKRPESMQSEQPVSHHDVRPSIVPSWGNRHTGRWRNLSPGERLARSWHDARWYLAPSAYLDAWIEKHLQIGDWYWLFLLGLNNSGTTLIKNLLESHPLMRAFPREGHRQTNALPHPAKLGISRIWGTYTALFRWTEADDPRPAARAKYDWARLYPQRPGILLEKSPTNTLRSRWVQRHFQPCRFLAIVRSPYAVCEGIRRREGCRIEEAARHWHVGNACLLEDMDYLDHCIFFRYEDFCRTPAAHVDRFQSFLDLPMPFDPSVISEVGAHSVDGRSDGVVDLNAKSLARLSRDDIKTIGREAGPLMERLGYDVL